MGEVDNDLLDKLDHVGDIASWDGLTNIAFPVRRIDDVERILEMLTGEGGRNIYRSY